MHLLNNTTPTESHASRCTDDACIVSITTTYNRIFPDSAIYPDAIFTAQTTHKINKPYFPGEDGASTDLLSVTDHSTSKTYLAIQDGNRNIMAYVDFADDTVVAEYEYSPFGKLTAKSGSMANDFNFKFSSYYTDSETNLVYYGYRYYDADMGRWINRDPIEESGGNNLYGFVGNDVCAIRV